MRKDSFVFRLLCLATLTGLSQAHANNAFDVNSPYMLGDWNGERTALKEQGYDFTMAYTGELGSVLHSKDTSGHDSEYAGQLTLGTNFDLEKILGWADTEAQITLTQRHGKNVTNESDALRGQLSSAQEVWGREETWRLTDFWIKKKFLDQKLDVKLGRYGVAEEFNSFACDFQNLAICGSQMGNWSGDQWYNWPVSQWAMRVKYNLTPELFVQMGGFEYNPENLERGKGFNLSTDGSHGAILPAEVVWSPKLTAQNLPGQYRLGYFYSTADISKLDQPTQTGHRHGGWVSMKQQLTAHQGDVSRGLTGSLNAVFFDQATNNISDMQNIALSYKGIADARPQDEIAVGLGRIHKTRDESGSEYNAEIYYGLQATQWLTVRPNVQYVHHVGADKDGNNAWVGGIKFITAF